MNSRLVYVGAYTRPLPHVEGRAEGIYSFSLDMTTGALTQVHMAPGHDNPSYLTLNADGTRLYAVEEMSQGWAKALVADPKTGALTDLNQQPSNGGAACHVSLDHTGHWLLLANYSTGSIAIYPVQADGSLGPASDFVQHTGGSQATQRQTSPHAHWIAATPDNGFVLVADLGLDKVLVYRLDTVKGKLVPHNPSGLAIKPGSGPRHMAFHPDGRTVFLVNEIDSTIDRLSFDSASGTLTHLQRVPTLPAGYKGDSTCAAIRVSPDGRFVYASNRGHDSLVIYAIDATAGELSVVGHQLTGGSTPRDFNIDPTGTFLIAANQNSHTLVTFRIDQATGRLTPTGHSAKLMTPVCVGFGRG